MSPAGDERRYMRAVERAWSKILGRPAVISPREFDAIDGWRRRGIPLAVVLEVLADFGKRHAGRTPKALTFLARAVEAAWSVVASGRATPNVTDGRPTHSDARRAWQEALRRCVEGGPLHELLTRLLAEEKEGVAATALDAALDGALARSVPEEMLAFATEETLHALEGFRRRMSEEEFRKTFARALVDRLRGNVGLPRMTLARPGPSRQPTPPRLE